MHRSVRAEVSLAAILDVQIENSPEAIKQLISHEQTRQPYIVSTVVGFFLFFPLPYPPLFEMLYHSYFETRK